MWEGTDRIEIAAPPEAVWAIIADLDNHITLAGSGEPRAITNVSGPLAVGTTFTSANVIPKVGDLEAREEIIEFDPPRALGWRSYPPPMSKRHPETSVPDIRWRYELAAAGEGTQVIHSFSVAPPRHGALPLRLFYLVARRRTTIVRGMRRTLQNLKAMAEQARPSA